MESTRRHRPILFLLVTVFLTAVGMTIVMPVLPFLVQKYTSHPNQLALMLGWLTATYSIFQFLAAPGLGALSDRYGRRPLMLICLLGSALGYLIFGIGGALWILFLGRAIDGLTGGDLSILMASLADSSEPEERGALFGKVGATVGVAFIIGPVIGGYVAKLGVQAPMFLTAALMLANMIWAMFGLPESLRVEDRRAQIRLAELNPFTQLRAVAAMLRLRWLLLVGFLYSLAFVFLQSTLVVLIIDRLGWQSDRIGLLFMVIGGVDILTQGLLIGRLLPIFGESKLAVVGMVGVILGFGLMGSVAYTASSLLLMAGVVTYGIGSGLLEPSLAGLTSRAAGSSEQGVVQGGVQSIRSVANIVGPLLAGAMYANLSHASPFVLGILIMGLAICAIGLASKSGAAALSAEGPA